MEHLSKNWTLENIAWCAGIIDGEGTFFSRPDKRYKNTRRNGIQVKMTDRDILERLQNILGGTIYDVGVPKYAKKEQYMWAVHKKLHIYAILVAMYSWFGKRRKQQVLEIVPYLL